MDEFGDELRGCIIGRNFVGDVVWEGGVGFFECGVGLYNR